jgi:hypothetical protein
VTGQKVGRGRTVRLTRVGHGGSSCGLAQRRGQILAVPL